MLLRISCWSLIRRSKFCCKFWVTLVLACQHKRDKCKLFKVCCFCVWSDIMRVESRPTLFSYSVLKKATKNFHISNKLGEGGFGSVFKVCRIYIYIYQYWLMAECWDCYALLTNIEQEGLSPSIVCLELHCKMNFSPHYSRGFSKPWTLILSCKTE
jgi:hypothetical protein